MEKKSFAAFIITFEREKILPSTIQELFKQSLPPERILVIDNSVSDRTQKAIEGLDPRVTYFRMGYNSGPAGGARKGLEMLAQEGYEWIFWGDDDDPPPTLDCFERLMKLALSYKGKLGQVGLVGHKFNKTTGTFVRTPTEALLQSEYLEVDSIGGGMCKIINSKAILEGVLPEEKLFFGFEDLDFDLASKKAGYNIIVHSEMFLECRTRANRIDHKHVINQKKHDNRIWREYYSIRNTLYIMKKNKLYMALFFTVGINIAKTLLSYRHGLKYGFSITQNTFRAFRDYSLGRYYKRNV